MASILHREILSDILKLGCDEGWAADTTVGEKPLATRLGVSRTPVRRALTALADGGILRRRPGYGFILNMPISSTTVAQYALGEQPGREIYQQILVDRTLGKIPDETTERALIARYAVARGDLRKALLRLSGEGIIYRQRGHGWRFAESLDTPQAILESYAFREAIETAALRQPGYQVDARALLLLVQAHKALMEAPPDTISPDMWFRVNANFHEKLVTWSQNRFFLQAMKRQNALRQMHQFADFAQLTAEQIRQSCNEHIAILDALSAGDRERAAVLLSQHLRNAAVDWV
jgi:DNA-binding GntR family transcriptional regulator